MFSEKAAGRPNKERNKRIDTKPVNRNPPVMPDSPWIPVNPQMSLTDRAAVTVGKTRAHASRQQPTCQSRYTSKTHAHTNSDEHWVWRPAAKQNDSRLSALCPAYRRKDPPLGRKVRVVLVWRSPSLSPSPDTPGQTQTLLLFLWKSPNTLQCELAAKPGRRCVHVRWNSTNPGWKLLPVKYSVPASPTPVRSLLCSALHTPPARRQGNLDTATAKMTIIQFITEFHVQNLYCWISGRTNLAENSSNSTQLKPLKEKFLTKS